MIRMTCYKDCPADQFWLTKTFLSTILKIDKNQLRSGRMAGKPFKLVI
tara:strand:+ start:6248 stop:6391 length:144 start_codon:yes stop_codon:yes gene_type:complete